MILSAVHICYDPSHQPFASEGAVKIEDLHSERPASKIIRAVIRYNGIDATSWESYSLHRCYCISRIKTEDQHLEAFKSELTLEELKIRDGDSVFIRKIDDRMHEMEEDQGSNSGRSSRKRKERADDESLHSQFQRISREARSNSRRIQTTPNPSTPPTAVDKVASNLENLTSTAAAAAGFISNLLGGNNWKTQSIGKLGSIQTRGGSCLHSLLRLVKTSLEIPQLPKSEPSGLFNSDLVEALKRAYHQRINDPREPGDRRSVDSLGLSDYERANELLRGKVNQDGSWERSSLAHLNESALSKPVHRFPLSDSGLSGQPLNTARALCALWNNDKWLNQAPLPGLASISLSSFTNHATLRQIAELTRVKPGEATPDGLPPIVLSVLKESIQELNSSSKSLSIQGLFSPHGWSQSKAIPLALEILKRALGANDSTSSSSPSIASGSGKKKRRIVAR